MIQCIEGLGTISHHWVLVIFRVALSAAKGVASVKNDMRLK